MNIDETKKLFVEKFYNPTYKDWRVNKIKAGKDIVGARYEDFRKTYYKDMGFEIGDGRKVFGSSYDCDTVVKKNGGVVILEEDKAHYVDSCFLGRALANCAEVMFKCIEDGLNPPKFVLSCSTKMNNFKDIFDNRIRLYRNDIQKLIKENFVYLPLCEHGRVSKEKYFSNKKNCFELSDDLIGQQLKFINGILNG